MLSNIQRERIKKLLPITSVEQFIKVILAENDIVSSLINIRKNDVLKERLSIMEEERKKTESQMIELREQLERKSKQMDELIYLNDNTSSTNAFYKGEFEEKKKELFLNKYFSNLFEIDGCKKMHCMDIRMNHKIKKYEIGIECKDKKRITREDVMKFKDDKLKNNFKGGIFLSIDSPIPKKVEERNRFNIINNELYIYSNDNFLIKTLIEIFINCIECDKQFESKIHMETVINLYEQFSKMKASLLKMDKTFITYMKLINKPVNNHLYLVKKSNCKVNKSKEIY
tara:strand:- start:224 stop:1078 length:855 start_codon:yes stop_codon:yes gene_type:complete